MWRKSEKRLACCRPEFPNCLSISYGACWSNPSKQKGQTEIVAVRQENIITETDCKIVHETFNNFREEVVQATVNRAIQHAV